MSEKPPFWQTNPNQTPDHLKPRTDFNRLMFYVMQNGYIVRPISLRPRPYLPTQGHALRKRTRSV